MTPAQSTNGDLLAALVRIPSHVVYRAFTAETVVLNLETGKYHGLNPTAGRMLEALERAGRVADAAGSLSEELNVPAEELEADLCRFCLDLVERGLIEVDGAGDG